MKNENEFMFPASENLLSGAELESQIQLFSDNDLFAYLLDSVPSYLVVLNEYRQIIYINKAFKDLSEIKDLDFFYGKRPGEVLNCKNASLFPNGCGNTCFCSTCGALKVILSSLKGVEDVQECRITTKDTTEAIDLRVWGRQLKLNGQIFSVFSFVDISHEKRRYALERIFFHDVINYAGALSSYIDILKDSSAEEILNMAPIASELTRNLLEEIKAQRALTEAESAELIVNFITCNSLKLIQNLSVLYKYRSSSEGKKIEIDPDCMEINFTTDELLISRVLGNMIKNALESSDRGSRILINCKVSNDKIQFSVNNPGYIPLTIQYQIFQRSFSTKGLGRGLGTYGMKFITERYLKGNVFFTSSENEGTTFTAEYPFDYN